jgi:DNA-binding response OmpR family regulator
MENAKLLLIEDDEAYTEAVERYMSIFGHEVIKVAHTRSEALQALCMIKAGELSVDAMLVDANLHGDRSGADGKAIYAAWLEHGKPVPYISNSSYPARILDMPEVDADAQKDLNVMREFLEEL